MTHFDKNQLPGVSLSIGGHTWKRIDDFESQGVLYWARPYYHTERDWNRHDVAIQGTGKFPAYTVELNAFNADRDEWGVTIMVTQGPDDQSPGMGGVLDGVTVEGLEAAAEQIRSYMREYSTANVPDEN